MIFSHCALLFFFFFNDTATTEIYTLSLHDALPIWSTRRPSPLKRAAAFRSVTGRAALPKSPRSEEHTSELQSPCNLVCRLLLEKKKKEDASSKATIKVVRSRQPRYRVAAHNDR